MLQNLETVVITFSAQQPTKEERASAAVCVCVYAQLAVRLHSNAPPSSYRANATTSFRFFHSSLTTSTCPTHQTLLTPPSQQVLPYVPWGGPCPPMRPAHLG